MAAAVLSIAASARAQDAPGAPFDRVSFFVGLDGSKQPQDLGINANIGPRFAINAGIPVSATNGLGVQLGAAVNLSDSAVHVLDQVEGTSRRSQVFLTAGVFQRLTRGSWALAYDLVREQYYDTFTLAQVRGEGSVRLSGKDELGVAFGLGVRGEDGSVGDVRVRLEPIAQALAFSRHEWSAGGRTTLWVGLASGHHNEVLVIPDASYDRHVLVYGARLDLPLNSRVSVTGAANLITPAATGTVDAFMGITIRTAGARPQQRSRTSPLLDVANNTELPVDLAVLSR